MNCEKGTINRASLVKCNVVEFRFGSTSTSKR